MQKNLEKYDKLITAILIIVAFVLGVGWWFAEEKSEPVYLSKIDKLMFDKDNKAPKFVLPLPDKLTATNTTPKDVIVDIPEDVQEEKNDEKSKDFSLDNLLSNLPNIQKLPNKNPNIQTEFIDFDNFLIETDKQGRKLPRISEDGRKPWAIYGNRVDIQPNFKKIAIVISGIGFDDHSIEKIANSFNSEVSVSITPYTPKPYEAINNLRSFGHETYVDLLLASKDFLKEDTGPLSINLSLSLDIILDRFYQTLAQPAPVGGVIIRDGAFDEVYTKKMQRLLTELKNRGLLMIDALENDTIANIKVDGLARRKADIVINKDMTKDEIEAALKKAENIAFDKGQVLIVTDPKPIAVMSLYEWIKTFSPQISYEEAKTIEIIKPFALVPLSNLVVE